MVVVVVDNVSLPSYAVGFSGPETLSVILADITPQYHRLDVCYSVILGE